MTLLQTNLTVDIGTAQLVNEATQEFASLTEELNQPAVYAAGTARFLLKQVSHA